MESKLTLAVGIHLFFALSALLFGMVQLLRKKADLLHKRIGWIWVLMMVVICVSSFWIKTLMPTGPFLGFSPLHLLSFYTLYSVASGIRALKRKDVKAHSRHMVGSFFGGLVIAGLFTLVPGRYLHSIVIAPISAHFVKSHP